MTGDDDDATAAAPSSGLVVRPGEGAGPVRWGMSVEDLVATLGPPTDRRRSPGAPDLVTWAGAWHGGTGELVVEVDGSGIVSMGVDAHVVQIEGRDHDLRDPQVLAVLDPVLHDGAHVFLDWGVELWGTEPGESSFLRAVAPALAAELRTASAGDARWTQVRATQTLLPTAARPWDLRPGEGLGPLGFGMGPDEVDALLGPPEKTGAIQGFARQVRGDLVCVFDPEGALVELRWVGLRAVHLDGVPLSPARERRKALAGRVPLVNRAWDVHVDLGIALERDGRARAELVVFTGPRVAVWTNLRRPLL